MTNTSSDVGTLFVIIMGSLIGIGTVAMGITSYSINKQLDNVGSNFSKKETTEEKETEELNITNDEEDTFEEEDLFNLDKDLSKYKDEDNEEYGINPGGWSKIKGGKCTSKKSKKTKKIVKRKVKKSKRNTSKK